MTRIQVCFLNCPNCSGLSKITRSLTHIVCILLFTYTPVPRQHCVECMVAFSCPFLGFLSIIGNMKMDALKFWHSKLCFCELKKISREQYFLDFGKLGGCFQILTLNKFGIPFNQTFLMLGT